MKSPEPPEEFTTTQADEWRAITAGLSGEWFPPPTRPLLIQFCRHVAVARRVAKLIADYEASDPFEIREFDRLLRMQETESRAISALATKMRITQQATFSAMKSKPRRRTGLAPWEK